MKGSEFEKICVYRMEQEHKLGRAIMGRYGTQSITIGERPFDFGAWADRLRRGPVNAAVIENLVKEARETGRHTQQIHSNPDFEGLISPRGRQFVFDAKVCQQASFPLDKESKSQSRQLNHMLDRDEFGAVCFYLIHFPERILARSSEPEQTWAFPVSRKHAFWIKFDRGEVKRITREDCREYAVFVEWNALPKARTNTPDIYWAIYELAGRLGKGGEQEAD
jgi:penicillin-binding protein-related factor A (putative recombinase)